MNDTDISKLKEVYKELAEKCQELSDDDSLTKSQLTVMLSRYAKLISDEEKLKEDSAMNKEKFELEKDHKYWLEKFEEKKLDFEASQFQHNQEMEKYKLELDKIRYESDRKFKWISLGVSIGVPAVTTLITLLVYRNLAYNNLKLIYVDSGIPSTDFKNSVKDIKNLIK